MAEIYLWLNLVEDKYYLHICLLASQDVSFPDGVYLIGKKPCDERDLLCSID